MMELMYQCPDNMTVFALDGAFRQPVLWVNKNGERFLNEDLTPNSTFTGCAIINQPENVGISIMDQKMVNTYKKKGPDLLDHVHGEHVFENWDADVEDALEFYAGAYGTLGGIKINHMCEVVTDDNKVIPGLYAVGTDACAIYGDCYPFTFAGNTMAFCLNTGRMAGENASEYIDEQ